MRGVGDLTNHHRYPNGPHWHNYATGRKYADNFEQDEACRDRRVGIKEGRELRNTKQLTHVTC